MLFCEYLTYPLSWICCRSVFVIYELNNQLLDTTVHRLSTRTNIMELLSIDVHSHKNPLSQYVSYLRSQSLQSLSVSTPMPSDNACASPPLSNPEKISTVQHLNVTPAHDFSCSLWTLCDTNMSMCTWEERDTCILQSFICPGSHTHSYETAAKKKWAFHHT